MLPVYNSLMSFKQYLFKSLPGVLDQLGTVVKNKSELESLAEDYHRALSYLGFSHYNLKNEYDQGEHRFKMRLWKHLSDIKSQISPSVSIDSLVQLCVKYFRSNF